MIVARRKALILRIGNMINKLATNSPAVANRHFVLSRPDSIGDVVLTLPMAGVLKAAFPGCRVSLLGRNYTRPLALACEHLDGVYAWDEIESTPHVEQVAQFRAMGADAIFHVLPKPEIARLAKAAQIPLRIATSRRMSHWLTCNRLVYLHRHHSPLHEAQLNLKLLRGVGLRDTYSLDEMRDCFGLNIVPQLRPALAAAIDPERFNLIVHPKSGGTSREWPIEHFAALIGNLRAARFNVFVTGSPREAEQVRSSLPMNLPHVHDVMGRLMLTDLIALMHRVDGLLAASTGPLHMAAAIGLHVVGLYAPVGSKHAGRWGPIGPRTRVFQLPEKCSLCRRSNVCACMRRITSAEVSAYLCGLARPATTDGVATTPARR